MEKSSEQVLNEFLLMDSPDPVGPSYTFEPLKPVEETSTIDNTDAAGHQNATDPEPANQAQPKPEPEPKIFDKESSLAISRSLVDLVSNTCAIVGSRLYPSKILHDGDAEKLEALKRKIDLHRGPETKDELIKSACEADPDLRDVLLRTSKVAEANKKAAFTQEEKESLIKPLAEVVEKYSLLQIGPEAMFIIALALVMAPRIMPLFPGYANFVSEKFSFKEPD